jgi:hypothetical protein
MSFFTRETAEVINKIIGYLCLEQKFICLLCNPTVSMQCRMVVAPKIVLKDSAGNIFYENDFFIIY